MNLNPGSNDDMALTDCVMAICEEFGIEDDDRVRELLVELLEEVGNEL